MNGHVAYEQSMMLVIALQYGFGLGTDCITYSAIYMRSMMHGSVTVFPRSELISKNVSLSRLQPYLSRRMTKSVSQGCLCTAGMVSWQLADDNIQDSSLFASMQAHATCIIHDLHESTPVFTFTMHWAKALSGIQ